MTYTTSDTSHANIHFVSDLTCSVDPAEHAARALEAVWQFHSQFVFSGAWNNELFASVSERKVLEAIFCFLSCRAAEFADGELVVSFVRRVEVDQDINCLENGFNSLKV